MHNRTHSSPWLIALLVAIIGLAVTVPAWHLARLHELDEVRILSEWPYPAATAVLVASEEQHLSTAILGGGLATTLLAALLVGYLSHARRRAEHRAGELAIGMQASEERFALAVQASHDGIWERDFVSGTYYASPRLEEMMGNAPDHAEIGVDEVARRIHPDDLLRWRAALKHHLEDRAPYDIELRLRHADGAWRWFRSRGQAIWDGSGRPVRMVGSLSDITATKSLELRLAGYREFLLRLLDVAPEPILVKDEDQRYVFVNRAYADFIGMPAADLLDRTSREILPPEAADLAERQDRQVLESGVEGIFEIMLPDSQGALRDLVVKKVPTTGAEGERLVLTSYVDVTDIRKALGRFETIIGDNPLVAIQSFGRDGRVIMWNRASEAFYGLRREQVLGTRLAGVLFSRVGEWDNFPEILANVWDTGAPFGPCEVPAETVVGHMWLLVTLFPIIRNGRVTDVFAMEVDITERVRMEEDLLRHRNHLQELVAEQTADLLRAKESAEQANAAKTRFLANMSHELRTPMHAVISFARIGSDRVGQVDDEKLREYFGRIQDSGNQLLALINDLLDLAKIDAGRLALDIQPVDLAALVRGVAADMAALLESRRLGMDFSVEGPAQVPGDRMRLAQVIRNLLGNAIKFSPEDRRIAIEIAPAELKVSAGGTAPAVRLSVLDEGVGIPEGELEAVFDKFGQSSRTRSGAGGTGLGLTICREIVDLHGGRIAARHRHGGGAAFDMLLPCRPVGAQQEDAGT